MGWQEVTYPCLLDRVRKLVRKKGCVCGRDMSFRLEATSEPELLTDAWLSSAACFHKGSSAAPSSAPNRQRTLGGHWGN